MPAPRSTRTPGHTAVSVCVEHHASRHSSTGVPAGGRKVHNGLQEGEVLPCVRKGLSRFGMYLDKSPVARGCRPRTARTASLKHPGASCKAEWSTRTSKRSDLVTCGAHVHQGSYMQPNTHAPVLCVRPPESPALKSQGLGLYITSTTVNNCKTKKLQKQLRENCKKLQ